MKNLLVTGGTSGIGLNFIARFNKNYEKIYVAGRDFKTLGNLKLSNIEEIQYDFNNLSDLTSLVDEINQPLDNIIFSAGFVKNNILSFFDFSLFKKLMDVNALSQLGLAAELAKARKFNKGASVVFISSLLGTSISMKGTLGYAASKAALIGGMKVLAEELSKKEIRVNAISPGMVQTPMTENLGMSELLSIDMEKYPLGKRYCNEEEVSSTINFLLSQESSFITGTNIIVDGGYTLR